eukprot:359668-Pyramimonas_sp.AAC.1
MLSIIAMIKPWAQDSTPAMKGATVDAFVKAISDSSSLVERTAALKGKCEDFLTLARNVSLDDIKGLLGIAVPAKSHLDKLLADVESKGVGIPTGGLVNTVADSNQFALDIVNAKLAQNKDSLEDFSGDAELIMTWRLGSKDGE